MLEKLQIKIVLAQKNVNYSKQTFDIRAQVDIKWRLFQFFRFGFINSVSIIYELIVLIFSLTN